MPLPAHLVEHMRALVAAADGGADHDQAEVAALAEELTAWVHDGGDGGYVPRAVLAAVLGRLRDRAGRAVSQPREQRVIAVDLADFAVLAALEEPPAWFVLADWGRMTAAEREQAERLAEEVRRRVLRDHLTQPGWYTRTPEAFGLPADQRSGPADDSRDRVVGRVERVNADGTMDVRLTDPAAIDAVTSGRYRAASVELVPEPDVPAARYTGPDAGQLAADADELFARLGRGEVVTREECYRAMGFTPPDADPPG